MSEMAKRKAKDPVREPENRNPAGFAMGLQWQKDWESSLEEE